MMKKTLIKLATILGTILLSTSLVHAAPTSEAKPDATQKKATTTKSVDINKLMPKDVKAIEDIGKDELKATKQLPNVSTEQIVGTIILQILEWTFVLTVIAIVVAAIYYVIARGNEEDINKSKNIILYLVIGMALIAASYGIIAGITQLEFFE